MPKYKRPNRNLIESLESRILLAVDFLNPHAATYTDFDGDAVTVRVSKGTLTLAAQSSNDDISLGSDFNIHEV